MEDSNAKAQRVQEQVAEFGPWKIMTVKSHILTKEQEEKFVEGLSLPHIPDMVFAQNLLKIQHAESNISVAFNPLDALKNVNDREDLLHVATAAEWREARKESSHLHTIVHPYDWTFSPTDYRGTVTGDKLKVEKTDDKINYEKLKEKEKILFYDDVILFEDELDDNGCSKLSVKIRVMPSGFFCLMRFYLRVDNTLIRVIDTRLYFEADKPTFMLREYSERETKVSELKAPAALWTDQNEIVSHLDLKKEVMEKLILVDS